MEKVLLDHLKDINVMLDVGCAGAQEVTFLLGIFPEAHYHLFEGSST